MDLGVRGRARWATVLGIVAALALIGGSLVALNPAVLSFDGWSTQPQQAPEEQTLPPEPDTAIDTGSTGGALALPGLSGTTGSPLLPALPTAGGGTGAAGGGAGGTPAGGVTGGDGGVGGYRCARGGRRAAVKPADGRGAQHRTGPAGGSAAGGLRQRRDPGRRGARGGDEPGCGRHGPRRTARRLGAAERAQPAQQRGRRCRFGRRR